ncbi:MAG: ACP S-malonyltransferase [Rhodospirillales bacterium]|nr:ACP S-malonyltransferase [Alphaproteobacteria bacterium]MCB9986930.1 ACP S-malonyltransferase [Rhodospirillales bacterium]USO08295.1 MAG: ACP S-malonyltransferase [Rhodospirillales bacterium]
MTRAFVFPGQGSQSIGMGKALAESFAEAREVFERINDALGQDLTKVMWEGAESDLNLTENTQPALFAVSMAVVRILKKQGGIRISEAGAFVAGHSLGEYSALTAVKALELDDSARLLRARGRAMQRAVPVGQGGMAAILGLDFESVSALARENAATNTDGDGVCEAANDNAPGQVVISGHLEAVQRFMALAQGHGAKRAIMLPVSAPFHCRLMAPAAAEMAKALAQVTIRPPSIPVVCNVSAKAEDEPGRIRQLLVDQITGRVRWRESIQWMAGANVTEVVELGAGKVLSGLTRRIDDRLAAFNAGTPAEIEALIRHIKG